MDASHYTSLKLLVLFLGLSHALSSAARALPSTRSSIEEEEEAMEVETFPESATLGGGEFVVEGGRGEGSSIDVEGRRMELEMKNDYPEPGPNPHHYPPPNPSKSTP